ncbi:group II intron reverse transcriptase/maturase, partial [Enterococcus faecium]
IICYKASFYQKKSGLVANAEKSKISRPNGTKFLVFCFDKYAKKYQLKAWEKNYS